MRNVILESPIEAGRAAAQGRQSRSSCPYELNAPTRVERALALAWVRAWDASNPFPIWGDDADPDGDAPLLGSGSAAWRRSQMVEEYVQKKYGTEIQVSASCQPDDLSASALVIGRGDRVVFVERGLGGWSYSNDPDIAREGLDVWDNPADTMTTAIARAVDLLGDPS